MNISHLFRYPVKGLSPEKLTQIAVTAGDPILWDRAFALALKPVSFDPARPAHLAKIHFLQLMRFEKAALLRSRFDPATGILFVRDPEGKEVCANVLTDGGRLDVASFIVEFMGDKLSGNPQLIYAASHSFSDAWERAVSIINLASIEDLQRRVGQPRQIMRFRANIYLSGLEPWAENNWDKQLLRMGTALIRIIRPIPRCKATQVNPDTAQRDADPVRELRTLYGHVNLGHFAEVVEAGELVEGDPVTLV